MAFSKGNPPPTFSRTSKGVNFCFNFFQEDNVNVNDKEEETPEKMEEDKEDKPSSEKVDPLTSTSPPKNLVDGADAPTGSDDAAKATAPQGDVAPTATAKAPQGDVASAGAPNGDAFRLECLQVQLQSALALFKEKTTCQEGRDLLILFQLIRRIVKNTVETLELLKYPVEDKDLLLVISAFSAISELFENLSKSDDHIFTEGQTGVECLFERVVSILTTGGGGQGQAKGDDGTLDIIQSLHRSNFVTQVLNGLQGKPVQKFLTVLLNKLLDGLWFLLGNLERGTDQGDGVKEGDVGGAFALLQIAEGAVVLGSWGGPGAEGGWIEDSTWSRLTKVEDKIVKTPCLSNVLVFLGRVITLAKRGRKGKKGAASSGGKKTKGKGKKRVPTASADSSVSSAEMWMPRNAKKCFF